METLNMTAFGYLILILKHKFLRLRNGICKIEPVNGTEISLKNPAIIEYEYKRNFQKLRQ